jgi:predicted ATPase/class 3 adenylate cyclase
MGAAGALPEGTVTFLFTDLEGSTRLLQAHPAAYRDAVRRHHELLRGAVEGHGGAVFETVGDAVYAAFAQATDAVAAALEGQVALQGADWGGLGPSAVRARMGLHTGEVEVQGGHYFGAPLYRDARLTATAHGGQVVLSQTAYDLVRDALPPEAALRDLGEHRLKDLQRPERVFQLAHPELPGEFPPLRSLDALPHNLPLQVTSFVGREREMADVRRLLATTRLLTLTGPGGTGKTRLALQVAADLGDRYAQGAWLAELAAVADPAQVPNAVAAALGVQGEPGRPLADTVLAALRERELLLVLDNCEHLLDACAALADRVLHACPRVQLLATSREALGIAGEVSWRVPSLALPGPAGAPSAATLTQFEAVQLFIQRAVAVQPAFRVTNQNAPAVAQICTRLDGIPLALELAAARVRALPPAQLLARLEDRFRLLTGGSRTALPRQQTLQAAVDWSYDLLSGQEQALFDRLSVFAGGFALEAAEAVCAGAGVDELETVDLLTRLVDKSLVAAEELPDGTARYALLETLRQYGRARLVAGGGAAALHERHAAHYLALTEEAESALEGPQQAAWYDRLEREHDNLRAALGWWIDRQDASHALRLAGVLWLLWWFRGYNNEGEAWLDRVLALPGADAPSPALVKTLGGSWGLAITRGWGPGMARARPLMERCAAVAEAVDDPRSRAIALHARIWAATDLAEQRRCAEEAAALAQEVGPNRGLLVPLVVLGEAESRAGNRAAAWALLQRCLDGCRAIGDGWGIAYALNVQRVLARREGDYARARSLQQEALAAMRPLGHHGGISNVLGQLARTAQAQREYPAARGYFDEAIVIERRSGRRAGLADGLQGLGDLSREEGDLDAARRAYAEALELRQALSDEEQAAAVRERLEALDAAQAVDAAEPLKPDAR